MRLAVAWDTPHSAHIHVADMVVGPQKSLDLPPAGSGPARRPIACFVAQDSRCHSQRAGAVAPALIFTTHI